MSQNNLCKRIIPCLDVANGRTVKGINFQGLRDMGDPIELAKAYENQGADEIVFLDITASHEKRSTMLLWVERVARNLSIPFTVGGGVNTIDDVQALLQAGADKVSVNTQAVKNPELITDIKTKFGSQCCVVAIDAKRNSKGITEVLIKGGRENTGMVAFDWAKKCVELGAGEILLTSWDKDGTQSGFDLELVKEFASNLPVPVIASGGAKNSESFVDVFKAANADAALAATIFHDGSHTVGEIKNILNQEGVQVRIC
ncbi:MAG: imidazole glycerol phosphate synthase subunit HisF [Candidatus Melainabacteria bacterium]|nr:imidazole glycerol phosphate synthase subunit HisF [Candidatus Melainabacteria bacterium]